MMHKPRAFKRVFPAACAGLLLAACAALAGCEMFNQDAAAPAGKAGESADLPYSILLTIFSDPERHIQEAQYYQQSLSQNLKWKGIFVINKAGVSELFWGRYGSPEAAQANLRIAKAHRTQTGTQPFALAFVVPLPGADVGPAAWNLRHANGLYTLLVATFQDDASRHYIGRKKFALDYCKRLRDGGYEAYFYHGSVISMVTIGDFSASAVSRRGGGQGGGIVVNSVVDPKVLSLQRDFPYLAINGNTESEVTRGTGGNRVSTPKKTALIEIPRDEANEGNLGGVPAPASRPAGASNAPAQPPAATSGPAPAKFRSEALP